MLRGLILSLLIVLPAFGQGLNRERGRYAVVGGGGGGDNPTTTNLITAYEFESGALLVDAHGTNDLTNGTSLGGAVCTSESVTPVVGNYGDCAGNDEWMGFTNATNPFLFGNVDFTFAFWFRSGVPSGFSQNAFGIWNNGNSYKLQHRDTFGGNVRWQVSDGTNTVQVDGDASNTVPATADWTFYVLWHDATADEVCLEIDNSGVPVCSAYTFGANSGSSAGFYVGTQDVGTGLGGSGSGEDTGLWDQMFLFDDVLTANERTWLYNSNAGRAYSEFEQGVSPGTTDLLVWWAMDDAAPTTDSHAAATNWTDTGSASATGVLGESRVFVRTEDDNGKVANASAGELIFGDEDFTICFWGYPTDITTNSWVIGFGNKSAGDNWQFHENSGLNGDIEFGVQHSAGGNAIDAGASNVWTVNTWNFVCGWHDSVGNTINIEINQSGSPASLGYTNGADATTIIDFYMATRDNAGSPHTTQDWSGRLDNVTVWGDILTNAEKDWLYNSGNARAYSDL